MKARWENKLLGEVIQLEYGKPLDSSDRNHKGEYPAYGANGIKDLTDKFYRDKPSIIVGRKGSAGEITLTEDKFWPLDVTYFVEFDRNQYDLQFLFYLLTTLELPSLAKGVKPGINRNEVYALPVKVPELPEQHRIVAILDEAFDGIATAKANAEKNLQNARALFESHLQAVFSQRGEGWTEKRLGEICERVSVGHVGPTSEFYCSQAEGIPFLRSQNVRRGYLDRDGLQYVTKEFHKKLRKSQLRTGDLLFVRVGANRGDCCCVPSDIGDINCANIVFARPIDGNAKYLQRYCDSANGREQLLGMTTGSAQGVINTSSVAELVIPLPPLWKQKQIIDSLNTLQSETQRLESIYQQKLVALDELKKSLLHQAFSGQL
jgi:type I restriction enzyme S subunit